MQSQYFAHHNEIQYGPYDVSEIYTYIQSGSFDQTTYIFDEDNNDWVLAGEHALFAPAFEGAQAPLILSADTEMSGLGFVEKAPNETSGESSSEVVEFPTPVVSEAVAPEELAGEVSEEVIADFAKQVSEILQSIESNEVAETFIEVPAAMIVEESPFATYKVEMINGEATWSLRHETSENISIELMSNDGSILSTKNMSIISGQATGLRLEISSSESVVGGFITCVLTATDDFGNLASNHNARFEISMSGSAYGFNSIEMECGRAHFTITNKVAESVSVRVSSLKGAEGNSLSAEATLAFSAGPVAQIILDGPETAKVGETSNFSVRAVDEFGNIALLCAGTYEIRVRTTSVSSSAPAAALDA